MLSTKNYWLYLEPYIHLSIKDNEILLYNTLWKIRSKLTPLRQSKMTPSARAN